MSLRVLPDVTVETCRIYDCCDWGNVRTMKIMMLKRPPPPKKMGTVGNRLMPPPP